MFQGSVVVHRPRRNTPRTYFVPYNSIPCPVSSRDEEESENEEWGKSPDPVSFMKNMSSWIACSKNGENSVNLDSDECAFCGEESTVVRCLTWVRENRRAHIVPLCENHILMTDDEIENNVLEKDALLQSRRETRCGQCNELQEFPQDMIKCYMCGQPSFCSQNCLEVHKYTFNVVGQHECTVQKVLK